MTSWISLLILAVLVLIAIVRPFWSRRFDRAAGRGVETLDEADRWSSEKDRLVAEQKALDLALAEGKLGEPAHGRERDRIAREAERVLRNLRLARRATKLPATRPRRHRAAGVVVGSLVLLAAGGLTFHLASQDVRRNESPHASGRVPLPQNADAASVPAAGNAASPKRSAKRAGALPDIGAMVAGLEARVKDGDAPVKDLLMLARSYRVLGRSRESIAMYRRVLDKEPENLSALTAAGSLLFESKDKRNRADADRYIETALRVKPNLPGALWYKSLALLRDHKVREAKATLVKLAGLVEGDDRAKAAVDRLLATLDESASKPAQPTD